MGGARGPSPGLTERRRCRTGEVPARRCEQFLTIADGGAMSGQLRRQQLTANSAEGGEGCRAGPGCRARPCRGHSQRIGRARLPRPTSSVAPGVSDGDHMLPLYYTVIRREFRYSCLRENFLFGEHEVIGLHQGNARVSCERRRQCLRRPATSGTRDSQATARCCQFSRRRVTPGVCRS